MAERLKIITPPFRVCFPSIFKASTFGEGDPKYEVTAIFHPSDFTKADKLAFKKMLAAVDAECQEAFKQSFAKMGKKLKHQPYEDADKKDHLGEPFVDGNIMSKLSSKRRPGLIDREKIEIIDESEFYPGCWARATVTVYSYDNEYGKGIRFGLQNLQKLGEGEALDGRVAANEDFGDDAEDVWGDDTAGGVDPDSEDPLG